MKKHNIAQINIKNRNSGSIDISVLSTPIVGGLCSSPWIDTSDRRGGKIYYLCAGSDDRSLAQQHYRQSSLIPSFFSKTLS